MPHPNYAHGLAVATQLHEAAYYLRQAYKALSTLEYVCPNGGLDPSPTQNDICEVDCKVQRNYYCHSISSRSPFAECQPGYCEKQCGGNS